MAGCLVKEVRALRRLDSAEVIRVLLNESAKQEVTKSLLSVLYNICLAKTLPLSPQLKEAFREREQIVLKLLKGASPEVNKTTGLQTKKRLLIENPSLVKLLAEACPARLAE